MNQVAHGCRLSVPLSAEKNHSMAWADATANTNETSRSTQCSATRIQLVWTRTHHLPCHHQAVAATPASLHTNVRKPCLPLIRCTCSAMGVILGGNSVCSCAAACCITSAVAPCFFKSLR